MNSTSRRLIAATVMSIAILVSIVNSGCSDSPTSTTSDIVDGIYKSNSSPFGKTYADWSEAWLQWAFGQSATDASGKVIHPLLDSTGANCNGGQGASASVFFLGGFLGPRNTLARTCTIPSGKSLFFPIINAFADSTGGWTSDSMRAAMDGAASAITDVSAEIDGHAVASPKSYHFRSVQFTTTLPDRNIYQYWGNPLPAGTVMPYLCDGYYLMLAPLSSGTHTIHFLGKTSDGVVQEVTYHLTVQ